MGQNYFNYFTEIEEYFLKKRGKNILVSPLDWTLIEVWKESGIPLNIALRGIDRSFSKAQDLKRHAPRTLYYCHPAVVEAFEEYQQSSLGAQTPAQGRSEEFIPAPSIWQFIQELEERLGQDKRDFVQRVRKRLKALRVELERAENFDREEVDRELGEIGRFLSGACWEALPSEARKQLEKRVLEETRLYKKRLSKEMFSLLKENYRNREILSQLDLPEFSLLNLARDV